MRHTVWKAAGIALAMALGVAAVAVAEQHVQGAQQADRAAHLTPPDKSDTHVAQLYEVVKAAHQPGAVVDHQAVAAKIKAIARAHAVEMGEDSDAMEAHVMSVVRDAVMAAQAHPEMLASLDSFYAALHTAGSAHGAQP